MSRWFRMYDEILDDPKVQRLPADDFRAWVNILALTSRNTGRLPPMSEVAFGLRMDENAARTVVERLVSGGLIDRLNGGVNGYHYAPHGWQKRQYKSDGSTDRVKRFRDRSKTVAVTPPETETETERSIPKQASVTEPARAAPQPESGDVTGHLDDGPGRPVPRPQPRRAQPQPDALSGRVGEVSLEVRRLARMVTVPGDGHLVRQWLEAGADPAIHIYPTVERLARGKTIGSFKYLDAAVREMVAAVDVDDPDGRLAFLKTSPMIPPRSADDLEAERVFRERRAAAEARDREAFYAANPEKRAAGAG